MSRILFLQNDKGSPGGVLLDEARAQGAEAHVLTPYPGKRADPAALADAVPAAPDGYDGVVILGGVMSVNDRDTHPFLSETETLIRQFADQDKPIMGVCLGAQLVASALGGAVTRLQTPEWGFLPQTWRPEAQDDPLLADAAPDLALMQWHGDTFTLPPGVVHLSERPGCPAQAFRLGRTVYGFQFHLELDRPTLERWVGLRAKEINAPLDQLQTKMAPEIDRHHGPQEVFARRIMRRWLGFVG